MAMNMMQSILDKTGMGGFRTGIGDRDQLMHSNVDLDTKGIANRRNQNIYENELLDNPMKAVERAQKIAAGESDTADILAGGRDRDRENKRATEVADLLAKQDENKRKQIEDAANAAVRAASIFKDDDSPILQQQKWPEAVRIAREGGLTNIPDEYSPDNFNKLKLRAQAAPMTIKQIQAMQSEDQKFKHSTQLETQKSGHALELADVNNDAALARTKVSAQASRDSAAIHAAATQRLIKDQDDRVQLAVENAIKTGTPVDIGTIQGLASLAEQYASQQVTKNKSRIEAAASKAARDGKPVEEARSAEESKVAAEARAAYMKRAEGVKIANSTGEVVGQVKDGKVVGVKSEGKAAPTGQAPAAAPAKKHAAGTILKDKNGNRAEVQADGSLKELPRVPIPTETTD